MLKFATAINCMDGRAQKPVIEYIEKKFDIDYVDMITEPGPNKILAEGSDIKIIESLKRRIAISVEKHGSEVIVIAAHYDCAGNPVIPGLQKEQLIKSVETIKLWGFSVKRVIALWMGEDFSPEEVIK